LKYYKEASQLLVSSGLLLL